MRLKLLRKQYNFSQEEVAKKIGTSQSNYSKYEKGDLDLSISQAIRLSKLYNISVDELIGNKKKTSFETSPEKSKLLKNIEKLTEQECDKVNIFIQGLTAGKINKGNNNE